MLHPFPHPVACCCVLLRVVAQSLKPVKLLSQRLPTFLLLRDLRRVAQQCWIRCTDLRTLLGPHTHITPGLESLMGCSSHDVLQVPTLLGVPFMRFKIMTVSILLGLKVCVGLNNSGSSRARSARSGAPWVKNHPRKYIYIYIFYMFIDNHIK